MGQRTISDTTLLRTYQLCTISGPPYCINWELITKPSHTAPEAEIFV